MTQVLFEGLVGSFRLAISLRIVSRSEVYLDVEQCSERSEELRSEF